MLAIWPFDADARIQCRQYFGKSENSQPQNSEKQKYFHPWRIRRLPLAESADAAIATAS
jgi:hypothetical protein